MVWNSKYMAVSDHLLKDTWCRLSWNWGSSKMLLSRN